MLDASCPVLRKIDLAPACAPVRVPVRACEKKIPVCKTWKSRAHADTDLRSPAKKQAVQVVARSRTIALQGFACIAREPKLIYRAEGAHIRTEMSRIPQSAREPP